MPLDLTRYRQAVAFCESILRPLTGARPSSLTSSEAHLVAASSLSAQFERMGHFLDRLGHPEHRFRSVHVAGTSGKGSTTTMIGAILRAACLHAGVHCSPYVQTPIERIQVDDLYISPDEFADAVDALRPAIAYMQDESPYRAISYREIAAAQAFVHFDRAAVDIASIETGMGGRFDYTNYIHPLVSAIVTVDFDHVIPLGPTIEKIAGHKAGIIKPAIPCVTAVAPGPARAVIEREAQALGAPLYRLGDEVVCTVRQVAQDGSVFDYASPWQSLAGVHVGLLGAHQVINAGIALSVAHLLRQSGYDISEDAMREGLRSARLPGRLEIVQRQPTVLLDGAHNPEKMRSLTAALNQIFPGQRLILVIGVLAAKQAEEIVAEVVPLASTVVVTSPHVLGKPAVEPAELAAICRRLSGDVVVEPDVPVAVDRARDLAGRDGLVCVTGSLYMVGQARELWVPTPMILDQCTSFPTRPDGSPRPVRSGSGRRSAYSDRPAGCAG